MLVERLSAFSHKVSQSESVGDPLVGVVVIAILHVQLLATAQTVAHLWGAPQNKEISQYSMFSVSHCVF